MKRKILLIWLLVILFSNSLCAQFIDNKVDVKIAFGITFPLGNKMVNEENFITPSLFKGYDNSYFYSIEGIYNYHENYSFGVVWNKFSFTNWTNNESELFSKSSSEISSFGPMIKFHTKFKQTGMLNKFELFTTLSPYIAFIKSNLYQEALFSSEPSVGSNPILESTYSSFGGKVSLGASYSLSQNIGFNLEIGGSYTSLNSQFYNDKGIFQINVGAGIIFKLLRNRRYYL